MASTAKQALYTKINQANGVTYNESNVAMSAPAPVVNPAISAKNTSVLLQGIPSAGKIGSARIYYNRRTLQSVAGGSPLELPWDTETMIADLIPKINQAFGIQLENEDLVDAELPDRAEGFASFSIVAAADSYGWTGFFVVHLGIDAGNVGDEIQQPEV